MRPIRYLFTPFLLIAHEVGLLSGRLHRLARCAACGRPRSMYGVSWASSNKGGNGLATETRLENVCVFVRISQALDDYALGLLWSL